MPCICCQMWFPELCKEYQMFALWWRVPREVSDAAWGSRASTSQKGWLDLQKVSLLIALGSSAITFFFSLLYWPYILGATFWTLQRIQDACNARRNQQTVYSIQENGNVSREFLFPLCYYVCLSIELFWCLPPYELIIGRKDVWNVWLSFPFYDVNF